MAGRGCTSRVYGTPRQQHCRWQGQSTGQARSAARQVHVGVHNCPQCMAILTGKIIISHGILDILEVPEPQEFHWHVRVIQCKCTNPFVVKRGKSTGCQRDVSLKTSGLRTVVVVSMSTIMLTTSSCHHQVVWKCNSSEACEFTGESTLGHETLRF